MDPLLNADGYKQREQNDDGDESTYVASQEGFAEYGEQDTEIYTYAGEELEAAVEKDEKPDFTSVDGWVVESGRIALPREITVRLEKMKWNAKFQDLWESLLKIMRDSEFKIATVTEAMVAIHNLYTEFVRTARFYAELLVKEKFSEKKTVKVINVGGIAGGDKYIADGIFFKFSTDNIGIYQGEQNAAKAAGLELRNLDSMMSMNHVGVSFPLLAVFDFYGYRVTCMSLLPVSGSTQKYGSSTAGQTVLMDDAVLVDKIESLAKAMNLQTHIGGCVKSTARPITLAVDCEGHRGTDGRIYILDTARAMAPEPPSGKGTVFYRLFRSEFVRVFSKPLCCDSFTSFCAHDPKEKDYQANIKEALNYYINVHIPKAVEHLESKESPALLFKEFETSVDMIHVITDNVARGRKHIEDNISLKMFLHHHGIGMRHLGIVWACCKEDYWRQRVAMEMILRICKNTAKILFRRAFERFRTPNNEAFVKFFIDYLNLLAGDSDLAREYWNVEIMESIKLSYFYHQGAAFDVDFFKELREKIDFNEFIGLLAKMIGVTFTDLPGINFSAAQPFQLHDLGALKSTTKELSVLSVSELFFCANQVLKSENLSIKSVQKNLEKFLNMILDLPEVPSNPFYDVMIAMLGNEVHQKLWDLYNNRNIFDSDLNEWSFDVTMNYGFFYNQYVYQRLMHIISNERAIKSLTQVEHQHLLALLLTISNVEDDDLRKNIGQIILGMYYKATDQQLKYETMKEAVKGADHEVAGMMNAWVYNARVLYFKYLVKRL